MIRDFFRKHRWLKYGSFTAAMTAVCTFALMILIHNDVFGKFKAKEPYVVGDAVVNTVTVTSEGANQKGKDGSGAKPCSPEVPTCEGKKGSKTNPFVVLEIVPDKSQQQMIYLGEDEDGTYPLDLMKIGIELAENQGKTYAESSSMMDQDKMSSMGQWFSNNSYSVYRIGSDTEKEKMPFAYIDKLYNIKVSDDKINTLMNDETAADRFAEIFKEKTQKHARDWHDIEKLADNFPEVFKKDSNGKKIRDIAIKDRYNWKAERETNVLSEEESETYKTGYMIMVEPGKGDFGFASEEDCKNWVFSKTGTDADRWIYVESEEEVAEKYPEYLENYQKDVERLNKYGFKYIREDGSICYWAGIEELYKMHESDVLTGLMLKLDSNTTCKYIISPKETESYYTFKYYGVTNHNILKRAIFSFKDEDDYDNFHMQIICMTPAELNKISKSDTDETVDMIERADMYFIQSGDLDGSTVNDTKMLENMYYTYVEPSETKSDEDITFYENDLEWSLCQKIIQRQSSVQTLPLVFNQMVGKLLELGISRDTSKKETHMYVTEGNGEASSRLTDVPAKGSRNNLSKLYLISIQFDLLARKSNTESYERTFMEDIYPNIKTISLPDEDGVVKGTASTTGYYSGTIANPRKLCTCDSVSQEFKERAYYLWNTYTFLPTDIKEQLNGNLSDETKENLISQGYQDSFFDTNDGNPFSGSSSPSHQSGSDGQDGKNVTIVSDPSNSNTNHSSILGNKGDGGGIANNAFETVYQIMNNQTEDVKPVTVIAVEQRKMYVKIADDTVMIDHEADGKTEADKELYLKVRFWNNENNRSGQVKSIKFVNEKNGNKKTMKLYTDKTFTKECENWKENENQYIVSVDDAYLEGYIRFSLNDWKKGYTTMRFETVGWIYNAKKKKEIEGPVIKSDISIIGKTLFDLE